MKKLLFFIPLFLFLSSPALATGSYPDVPEDYKNFEAIEYLDEMQIINGYEDGTFGPDNLVNRAEALKIIIGALKIERGDNYEEIFVDISQDEWFFRYIMAAHELGIVNGYEDGTFKPADQVNLAETMKMLVLASKVKLPDVSSSIFVDVSADAWFAPYMLYARNHNIILSDDYGYVAPDQSMTRAEFAEVIYRMMIVLENDEEPFPLHKDWPVFKNNDLPFSMKYDPEKWDIVENDEEVIFWRADNEFSQFSPAKIYPNSAKVTVTIDKNEGGMSAEQYFANIQDAFTGATYTEFKLGELNALEVLYPEKRIADWYVYLGNGNVLAIYTEYGAGGLGYQIQQVIGAMLDTLEYREIPENGQDYSNLLSQILENVLVEGTGMNMLNLLPDKLIIETDTIGVGTGPVDYYYSESVDYTFKYEREGDTILDTREGETTVF